METKKKRKALNTLMGVLVVVIIACGVMVAGGIKGWFNNDSSFIECEEIEGIVNIERDDIAYSIQEEQKIYEKDIIETKVGSGAVLKIDRNNRVALNEHTELIIAKADKDDVGLDLTVGEIFADLPDGDKNFEISFGENKATVSGAVFSISIQTGSAALNIYGGEVMVVAADGTEELVSAGNTIHFVSTVDGKTEVEISEIKIESLNAFVLDKAVNCGRADELCFTESEMQEVIDERNAETAQEKNTAENIIETGDAEESDSNGSGEDKTDNNQSSTSDVTVSKDIKTCTIQIKCNTILNNKENLTAGKDRYVPSNGVILASSTVEFTEGETVFDVLKRVCSYAGIPLEYAYTPIYESYYIEGINNLYEFDCGPQSGWMYKVNGWFPNYGCSSYELKDGDSIVWCYSCEGLGSDVGGSNF